jgi:hypothetical protein
LDGGLGRARHGLRDRGSANVTHHGLSGGYVGTTDVAHSATRGHLLVRHLNLRAHRGHLARHLGRARIPIRLHGHASHARRAPCPGSHLASHTIVLLKGVELSGSGSSGHRGGLRGRDTVWLGHGSRDTVALGEVHLLVNSAGPTLRLLVVLLRRNDR